MRLQIIPTMDTPDSEPKCGACCNVNLDELRERVETYAREEPLKAAGIALAAGVVLSALPIGRVVGGVVRAGLALVKPALLVLGGVKLCEEIERRRGGDGQAP